ncbi:hypothetical protein LEP1GSC103_3253 [Leptospira borgpetersenii serovar Javanica str. UI 09931]|uniref:Uncharacterized protein n=4 Tax=Leptospira borgpetersenii TaxID=174 RepID=M3HI96_LEPBO|nr:hypothetical protein LBBP_02139 [Leptospira borgpetersenii serovar Ballum]EKQ90713.1 hypothetical protein LEP1GSC101_0689 [Leptospira borgpetersenii str. UI 09149]EKR00266.1 hypothetical protein LEP1GSC121_3766 [Leptospira borgpetersenii serovar Castellonis str. 200801910]EMF97835.1 hypothetical protein LEP1GSC123_4131 [Leptospira borgpetersenii str. 200701203]EMK14844.1 hypothetical protein LEP1GSC066_0968 [Leptospira sp. serovar Kenya str. Sh9]EMN12680.1 hypothetical protein LEP1GSC055_27
MGREAGFLWKRFWENIETQRIKILCAILCVLNFYISKDESKT